MPRRERLLIIHGDVGFGETLKHRFESEGYYVSVTSDGLAGLQLARREIPQLIILDVNAPRFSGQNLVRALSTEPETVDIPVIMVSPRVGESDIVTGINLGADDVLPESVAPGILVARVASLIRRQKTVGRADPVIAVGPLVVDLSKHDVRLAGKEIYLTGTEFKLLALLVTGSGRVIPRIELVEKTMDVNVVSDRAADVHLAAIRKKLGEYHWMIQTIRGAGYKIISQRQVPAT